MFRLLGKGIAHRPAWFIVAWLALVAMAATWSLGAGEPPLEAAGSFLPRDSAHDQAVDLLRRAFPALAATSYIAIVNHRPGGLEADDFAWMDRLATEAGQATEGRVLSPAVPFLRQRLVSRDQEAALVVVNLSANFVSPTAVDAVKRVEALSRVERPEGLVVEITGTAGIGRDYFEATQRAVDRTTWVTVTAVLLILLFVYRAPLGALVPLVSIGASAFIALAFLSFLSHMGWGVSAIQRIFAIVLIFGAGVDYALFWMSRYGEGLRAGNDLPQSAFAASRFTGPAVLASAATTICGLSMMIAAELEPSRQSGRVLAIVLIIALMAALTLTPAVARLLGRAVFWPGRPVPGEGTGGFVTGPALWQWLAALVTSRPRTVLAGGLVMLAIPALLSARLESQFDAISELPPDSSSWRGFHLAKRHFAQGQLYSNTLLLVFDDDPASGASRDLEAISNEVSARILEVPGVREVYALDRPLGEHEDPVASPLAPLLRPLAQRLYLAEPEDMGPVLRFEILLDHPPFSSAAVSTVRQIQRLALTLADQAGPSPPDIHMTGPTPYIIAIRQIAGQDQRRVMVLATGVILLIVLALVRDVPLAVFMLLATWLTWGATMTLSHLFFVHVMGLDGLDWKVRLILFVIVVAVGQDYNLFLVSRLYEARANLPPGIIGPRRAVEVTREAIVRTGSVISSCGLIMAATLGSLWAGQLSLLQQLGFALALGILIDTFFVRPLLIPSFYLVVRGRTSL